MYCVLCSILLRIDNQAGMVCREGKRAREGKRRERGQMLRVHYCAGCGKPYHPVDQSIGHRACRAGFRESPPAHPSLVSFR